MASIVAPSANSPMRERREPESEEVVGGMVSGAFKRAADYMVCVALSPASAPAR